MAQIQFISQCCKIHNYTLNPYGISNKYTIPAGVMTTMHIYYLHQNPDQFPNPQNFEPNVFLLGRVAKRHPYAYIPFSAGPRKCIEQKFALLEEKTVLSYFLCHYELRSLVKREDINLTADLILKPENGLQVVITRRDSLEE
ncbi:Cytochrome P450 4C1 [Zootermopsis nevadensis]|uniref:Cytochrome P450 4C1 n=2 Tax=Zootermopsis nevadensis TaxID=136037 RepID=A0A067QRH1_ZOONE|nr:Cytochrome P450 4C1 [Zootermopsis nevadensis]KDR11281.1 Cytochrome P450 4C1 [Zootermopsis nevadensis]